MITNEERLKILRKAEVLLQQHLRSYICAAIHCAIKNAGNMCFTDSHTYTALYYFAELLKYKPEDVPIKFHSGWFGDPFIDENRKKRVDVVRQLIKEIEAQTN
jgi:hypothetical protein